MLVDKKELIASLKQTLVEIHEEEQYAKQVGNHLIANGLACARVKIEITLEAHGIQRPARLENAPVHAIEHR